MEKLLELLVCVCIIVCVVSSDNSTLDTALYIQSLFCETNYCSNKTILPQKILPDALPVIPPDIIIYGCCKMCACDAPRCKTEGGCCLDTLEDLPTKEESMSLLQQECEYPQLRPYHEDLMANAIRRVWMYRRCGDVRIPSVTDRCEHPEKYEDLHDKIPVVDNTTFVSYRNRFCALCNGASEENLVFWKVTIGCLTGLFYPQDMNSLEMDIKETNDCNLIYDVPAVPGLLVFSCTKVISTCNETGLWKKYDPFIESACHAYMTIYDFRYKNVFCYMCNTADSVGPVECFEGPDPHKFLTFAALLKLPESKERTNAPFTDSCDEYHIFDPVLNKCQKLQCRFPKSVKERQCMSSVTEVDGVLLDFFLELRPLESNVTLTTPNNVVKDALFTVTDWLHDENFNPYLMIMYSVTVIGETVLLDDSSVEFKTDFEYILLSFRWLGGHTTLAVIDNILTLEGHTFALNVAPDRNAVFQAKLSHWYTSPGSPYNTRTRETFSPMSVSNTYLQKEHVYGIETISMFNTCPYVVLSLLDVTAEVTNEVFYLPVYQANVSINDILVDNSSIYICLEQYEQLMGNFTLNTNASDWKSLSIGQVKYIVSYVLVLTSIFFAFLTFVVFCLFKELRPQPGINNMLLSLFLVLCLLFFQFGYDRAEDLSSSACAALGVCVHFSWLMLLTWMNACSIHMFRVFFVNQTVTNTFNMLKTTSLYIMYSFTLAAIPVIVNVVYALIQSHGSDIGYGGEFCYIKRSDLVIYILTIPLGLIISFNVGLYIIVVVQMNRARCKMGNRSESHNLASAYAKLSTITGATWLFGFLYLFTEYDWAEYSFVVLNACQGIFIFIAFIVNKRVVDLFKGRFCKKLIYGVHTNGSSARSSDTR